MRIYAFRGRRYAASPSAAGQLIAPPFDQIDEALRDRLHQAPHHYSHLTKPTADGGTPYAAAADLQSSWVADGTVIQDPAPAIYPYTIDLPDGGRRLGLCCLVGIEAPETGVIRPHERTVEKTITDRLELTRATRTDLEPVMLLADDGGGLDPLLSGDVEGEPLVEHRDADGNVHRLYAVPDPERIAAYRSLLADAPALIADGHHRYRVASMYAAEIGAAPGTAAGAKLAVLISLASPALTIDPIHRGLAAPLPSLADAAAAAVDRRSIGRIDGDAIAAAVAEAPAPALGVQRHGEPAELWHLDPGLGPDDLPAAGSTLPAVLLHHAVLTRLGLDPASATDGRVQYRSDPAVLGAQVTAGQLEVGFWLPPMSGELFGAAIADGDLLPPKSTRFMPKLVSGMVWSPHDAEVA